MFVNISFWEFQERYKSEPDVSLRLVSSCVLSHVGGLFRGARNCGQVEAPRGGEAGGLEWSGVEWSAEETQTNGANKGHQSYTEHSHTLA